jgi:small-conductance mechanosensitive channel
VTLFLQIASWGNAIINYWINHQVQDRVDEGDPMAATSMNVFGYIARVIMWSVLIILILDNLPGIEADSLIASLGIGGVAVALAVQNILGDLFASLSIILDKPFAIGDFLVVGDYSGTVEKIGLNTTRIRSLSGEEIIFSNSDLVGSRIKNFRTMNRRRVCFTLGIKGDTPHKKLLLIPGLVKETIEANDLVTFDRVHFKEFGTYALNYEVVFFIEEPSYTTFMDIQQAINLKIHERFEDAEIEFAYPTQMIILENPKP